MQSWTAVKTVKFNAILFVALHSPQGELLRQWVGVVEVNTIFFSDAENQGAVALQLKIIPGLCKATSIGHLICC